MRAITLLSALWVWTWAGTAFADDWKLDFTPLVPTIISYAAMPGLAGWETYSDIVNIQSIRRGARPETGALTAGYALGALQLANGLLTLTYTAGFFDAPSDAGGRNTAIALGTLSLAQAGLGLVTTIWAHTLPRHGAPMTSRRVGVAPLVLPGPNGVAAAGVQCGMVF